VNGEHEGVAPGAALGYDEVVQADKRFSTGRLTGEHLGILDARGVPARYAAIAFHFADDWFMDDTVGEDALVGAIAALHSAGVPEAYLEACKAHGVMPTDAIECWRTGIPVEYLPAWTLHPFHKD
jgi:hypothetical protein